MKWRECLRRFARFRWSASARSRRALSERPSRFARMLYAVSTFSCFSKDEIVVCSHAGQQESQRALFRFFAPPGARRAFSRRRPPFEHFHDVFLSISHVASKKRARAKREKTSIPNRSKSSNGGNAPSGLLGFAGAPRRAPSERVLSAPRVSLECSMPFACFHVFHATK